ncbi:sporulation protein [Bacillus sp. FJAT-49736]|nr:sporulation protein [Bacillus sp. FJAT-49736]
MAIIALILYRRIKRSIGFQPFKRSRLTTRIVIFSIITVLLLGTSALHPISYLYDLLGIILGSILVMYAMKHSTFEMRNTTLYYRTHIWIESLVLFIFLSRFAYRIVFMLQMTSNVNMNDPQNTQYYAKDPLTMGVFFLLAAYYIGFYSFVIKRGTSLLSKEKI